MDSKPKAKVYVDGANVFYMQKKDIKFDIDWKKMKEYLQKEWDVVEVLYYLGIKEKDANRSSYLKYLDHLGFKVITKPLKVIKIDHEHPLHQLHKYTEIYKCNFDVEITTDILLDRVNIDEVILFSGDSDFDYLVQKLKNAGKGVTIFSSRKMLSWELKMTSRKYVFLEDIKEKVGR